MIDQDQSLLTSPLATPPSSPPSLAASDKATSPSREKPVPEIPTTEEIKVRQEDEEEEGYDITTTSYSTLGSSFSLPTTSSSPTSPSLTRSTSVTGLNQTLANLGQQEQTVVTTRVTEPDKSGVFAPLEFIRDGFHKHFTESGTGGGVYSQLEVIFLDLSEKILDLAGRHAKMCARRPLLGAFATLQALFAVIPVVVFLAVVSSVVVGIMAVAIGLALAFILGSTLVLLGCLTIAVVMASVAWMWSAVGILYLQWGYWVYVTYVKPRLFSPSGEDYVEIVVNGEGKIQ
ncbi:hypothetical protein POJ06DRAFT_77543 [Lipomyces tetrasporus]|uniref:Uncharacterized protein n=1 Tax=Lipomyces tetrasporus TaxID=54092 RepID=A0AAD7QVB3_9ASCO|nr:uncharacterized protein POJ06DRAFT_77543 [Lipomyces tetrasporus]KAJ8102132.1 hypothetical protein POJ06DRAFT_77543 [Lipomyces tetrasporus]